jgi:hypothetical protein
VEEGDAVKTKCRIEIICNKSAAKNLHEILEYFRMMGKLGVTRDFIIGDDCKKEFTFDGDGPDRIEGILITEFIGEREMP